MEINILEENKNKIVLEIKKEGHTLANALRKELFEDEKTKIAAYEISHMLVGEPKLILETEDEPKKALINAAKRLQKTMEKIKEEAKKLK